MRLVGDIFSQILLPILMLVGVGAGVQRALVLDLATLSRINIYIFVPAFLFVRVYENKLSWAAIGGIAAAVVLPKIIVGSGFYLALRARRVERRALASMVIGGVIYNAGNFGIPLAQLAYGDAGGEVQAWVVMLSNLAIWCVGYSILSWGQGDGARAAMAGYFKLPMIYVLAAALLLRHFGLGLPRFLGYPLHAAADAMVALGLVTLGAQLAQYAHWPKWRRVAPVVFTKLLLMPAATAAAVLLLGLWPWPGAMLIAAAAAPTAINTLLLTIELEGDAELAAHCVFWNTLLSGLSVALVLVALRALGAGPP